MYGNRPNYTATLRACASTIRLAIFTVLPETVEYYLSHGFGALRSLHSVLECRDLYFWNAFHILSNAKETK